MSFGLYISHYLDNKDFCNFHRINRRTLKKLLIPYYSRKAIYLGWEKLAEIGDLQGIKLLDNYYNIYFDKPNNCSYHVMDIAAYYGNLDIIKYLHKNRIEGCSYYAVDWAAMRGHRHVVEWLLENRNEGFSEWAIIEAAKNNYEETLIQLLCIKNFKNELYIDFHLDSIKEYAMELAAKNGHLNIIKILHKYQYIGTDDTLFYAIVNCHKEVVEYLCKNELFDTEKECLEDIWIDAVREIKKNNQKPCTHPDYIEIYKLIYGKMFQGCNIRQDIYHKYLFKTINWIVDTVAYIEVCFDEYDVLKEKILEKIFGEPDDE